MKKIKRMCSLALAGILAASLAGCSGGQQAETSAQASEQTEAASETQAAQEGTTAADAGDRLTITFINGFTGGDGPFMTKIVDAFNESQDKYYIEQLQDADHYTKFKSDDFDIIDGVPLQCNLAAIEIESLASTMDKNGLNQYLLKKNVEGILRQLWTI